MELVTLIRGFMLVFLFSFYVCVFLICGCVPSVRSACTGQKRESDPLGLELQMTVSHHVGAGNQTYDP